MNIVGNPLFTISLLSLLFWLVTTVVFFLIIRELMLWYWRINENTESLKRIADSLEIIATAQDFMAEEIDKKNGHINTGKESTPEVVITEE